MSVTFLVVAWGIVMLMLLRTYIVMEVRMRRIREISAANTKEIGRADFIQIMERRYKELETPGYYTMMLDLRCWTYRQFYPHPVT